MSTTTQQKKQNYKFKSTFNDLHKLFGLQLEQFTKQFIDTCEDIDEFLTDFDNNNEKLDEIINEWCEKEETSYSEDLKTSAAIFMLAFIDRVDELTADEDGELEDNGPFTSNYK